MGSQIDALKELLVGRTISDVKFTDLNNLGGRDITLVLDNGDTLQISADAEFDGYGDFDESRLYFALQHPDGKFSFDNYFS